MKGIEFLGPRDKLHEWRDKSRTGGTLEASHWENIRPTRLLEVTFFFLLAFHRGAQVLVANGAAVAADNGRIIGACIGKG